MAEKEDGAEEVASGGGKMKLIIIIAVVVIIGAAAAFFLLGGEEAPPEDAAEEVSQVKQPAIYHSIEKPIIVNFGSQSKNAVRYLSVQIKVMARDQAIIDAFTLHTPAIQHELMMLLFSQEYDALNTSAGKKELKKQALSTVNETLKSQGFDGEVEAIYITNLIMQ